MKALFYKDGQFSKTSFILIATFVLVALRYTFGGLILFGFSIPEFSAEGALAFFGIASSLYFANHNIRVSPKQTIKEIKTDTGENK